MLYLIINLRKKHGIIPFVLLPKHGPFEQKLIEENIDYLVFTYASWRGPRDNKIVRFNLSYIMFGLNVFQAIRLTPRFKKMKIDLIHSNSSLAVFGYFLKFFLCKPLIWHLREFGEHDYHLTYILGKNISGKIYNKSDYLIAISKSIKRYYENIIPNIDKIILIYNGVKPFEVVHKEKNDKKINICIVGGISENKNQIESINAISVLINTYGIKNISLYIIGSGDHIYVHNLVEFVKRIELENIVFFLGERNDIRELLSIMDIAIINSKNEAFGRVIIEYMFAKLPVVASNKGACVELINDNVTGLLYELGNVNSLANKLNILINDNSLRKRIGENGNKEAITRFSDEKNASLIFNIYKKLNENKDS